MRLALVCLLLAATSVAAQETTGTAPVTADAMSLQSLSLEELLAIPLSIGGGRYTTALEAPASVWVIDKDIVRDTAALSLYETIRQVPGTTLYQYGPGQIDQSFRFKGTFPENQTAVLLNGSSVLNEGLGIFDQQMVNLNDVESIEVVLGPSSTLYGANAFSGVLNYVTKHPLREGTQVNAQLLGGVSTGSPGNQGDVLGAGAAGEAYAAVSQGWRSGGIRLSAGISHEPSFGFEGFTTTATPFRNPVETVTSLLVLEQDLPRGWLLGFQGTASAKSGPFSLVDATQAGQQGYTAALKLSRQGVFAAGDELRFELNARRFGLEFQLTSPSLRSEPLRLDTTTTELKAEYRPVTFFKNNLTVGAQVGGSFNDVSPRDIILETGKRELGMSLFAEDTYRPLNPLLFTAGVRVDAREYPGVAFQKYFSASPRASAVWLFKAGQALRLEYSSAFRVPSAIERAAYVSTVDGRPLIVGSPQLESERVNAFQLGYEGHFGAFVPRAEVYVAQSHHNITPDLVPFGEPRADSGGRPLYDIPDGTASSNKFPYYYGNIDAYLLIPGATARLEYNPRPGIRTYLLYTLSPIGLGHQASLNQYLSFGRFSASANVFFNTPEASDLAWSSPGHLNANVKLAYVLDARAHWTVALSGLKIFDVIWRDRAPAGGVPFIRRDASAGELVGPRIFATVAYALN